MLPSFSSAKEKEREREKGGDEGRGKGDKERGKGGYGGQRAWAMTGEERERGKEGRREGL